MTTEAWQRVRALFQSALEQPPETRAAFLSTACAGDEAVLREVESLLAAHVAAGGFLETPAFRLADGSPPVVAPALKAGDRLGAFDVIGSLGAGGMGEVYRARDSKLGREVAIKLLPRAFASDPQRLARFERESRLLASLNHPNIAAIHSVEQIDGLQVLVLELVEGPTLADRLRRGALPVREALEVARELSGALEAAHERGIVHRDLKPANVKITPSGRIKLLDFGLAKERVGSDPDARSDARTAADETTDGLVLGTSGYMSPEQARGKPVDKRTDIWAFGCVLYEMLTGTRAFAGETPSDTIAAVLERQPDWTALPGTTPAGVRRLVQRCLEKDPDRRLHDIADGRIEIDDLEDSRDRLQSDASSGTARRRLTTLAGAAAAAAVLVAAGWWLEAHAFTEPPAARMTRFTWTLPAGLHLDSPPTVSPDGQHVAFTALAGAGHPARLYVRPLNTLDARPIPGTEDARQPFWSPDGRSLGFFARSRLMKVAIDGGAPVEICPVPNARGGAWSRTGVIVFSPNTIDWGLMRVSAAGGPVEPATLLDSTQGENAHRWPAFLPDGIHFLYFVRSVVAERRGVYVGRVDRPATTPGEPLFRSESEAVYASIPGRRDGVLLNAANAHIEARPFDPDRRVLTGDPTTIDIPAAGLSLYHASMLSVSADTLAHVGSSIPFGQRLASSGRNGEDLDLWGQRGTQNWPRLSPDGRRLAWQLLDAIPGSPDLWVEDLERGTRHRVTRDGAAGVMPVWSPDGGRLAFVTGTLPKPVLVTASADGTGATSPVPCPRARCEPTDWSADGRWLLTTVRDQGGTDVWMLAVGAGAASRPLLAESYPERDARFSPDGRLVAYVSEETRSPEVMVQTVDEPRRREVISVGGGNQPVWSRDGNELFFVDLEGALRSARMKRAADGRPIFDRALPIDVPRIGTGHFATQYDVSPDGRRIYFLDRRLDPAPAEFGVVLGWRALLE